MEGKRGRGRPRQKLMDWMIEEGYRKRHNTEKSGVVGHLDLPGGPEAADLKKI